MNTRSSMPNLLERGKTVKTKNPKPFAVKKTGKPKRPKKKPMMPKMPMRPGY